MLPLVPIALRACCPRCRHVGYRWLSPSRFSPRRLGLALEGSDIALQLTSEAVVCEHQGVRDQLVAKLRPDRFTAMSGKMAAVVGYILEERFSDPAISELVVTSDGFVLAQAEGEVGADDMLGTEKDLNRNLLTLIQAAGLTPDEITEFGRLQRERIRRYH